MTLTPRQARGVRMSAAVLKIPQAVLLERFAAGESWCSRCATWHPLSAFGRLSHRWSGRAGQCKASSDRVAPCACGRGPRAKKAAVCWRCYTETRSQKDFTPEQIDRRYVAAVWQRSARRARLLLLEQQEGRAS